VNTRIDYTVSPSDSLFGRVTFDHATQFYPYAFDYGRQGTYSTVDYLTKARNFAVSETHIFSSHVLNQVTGGYNYVVNFMTPIGEGQNLSQQFGIPGANLGDPENSTLSQINPALGFTSLGDRVFTPFTGGTKVLHISDALTFTNGAHTVKGRQHAADEDGHAGAGAYAGAFSFDQFFTSQFAATGALNAATGAPIASLLLGLPASGNRSQSFDGYTTTRSGMNTADADDTWQLSPDLTLNLAWRTTSPRRRASRRIGWRISSSRRANSSSRATTTRRRA
jgi:hypothetical protein